MADYQYLGRSAAQRLSCDSQVTEQLQFPVFAQSFPGARSKILENLKKSV